MPYLGNQPFEQYSETKTQVLTGNGTVGPYTLDYEVGSVGDVEVFVNNVRQQGGSSYAYTVSGNQLTMTGAVASTDDFYVVFQGKSTPSGQIPEKQSNGDYTFDDGTLFIDASTNNIGVGITSPAHELHLHKDSSDSNYLLITNSTTGSNSNDGLVIGLAADETALIYHQENSAIRFGTSSVERMRVTNNGLTFNGDTAAANALDDYEEGTWTPAVTTSGASPTYSTQSGYYTKIGRVVHWKFQINISGGTFGSGNFKIGGFPFTATSSLQAGRFVVQTSSVNIDGNAFDMYGYLSSDNLQILYSYDNAGWSVGTVSNFVIANGSIITSKGTYFTDA